MVRDLELRVAGLSAINAEQLKRLTDFYSKVQLLEAELRKARGQSD